MVLNLFTIEKQKFVVAYIHNSGNGMQHGQGVKFLINGDFQSGTWVDNTFQDNYPSESLDQLI